MTGTPIIPENITVHLGRPDDVTAPNVIVPFNTYLKNVASSEIYPTWPENAIRANIYAQSTYALNRIYTEWYPSRGYDFDITNSTQFDQAYVDGREVFENVALLVDEQFDNYVVRQGSVEPLFTQYCNGTTSICDGLSQWGTVPLAEKGLTPYQILQNYYGDDINIVFNAPIAENLPSYTGIPLKRGSISNEVKDVQIRLNRVSTNYPLIPKIYPINGIFDLATENAVKEFQRQFNLTPDGIVGKATWYRLQYLYNSVKRLSELDSEGLTLEDISKQFPSILQEGDTETGVRVVQYYLSVLSQYYPSIPPVMPTGEFNVDTTESVKAFQLWDGLMVNGIVGRETWNSLNDNYLQIINAVPEGTTQGGVQLFKGTPLVIGSTGKEVETVQTQLNYVGETYKQIPTVLVTGIYDEKTSNAVKVFQELFGITPIDGVTTAITWDVLGSVYSDIKQGFQVSTTQFAGYTMNEEVQ